MEELIKPTYTSITSANLALPLLHKLMISTPRPENRSLPGNLDSARLLDIMNLGGHACALVAMPDRLSTPLAVPGCHSLRKGGRAPASR